MIPNFFGGHDPMNLRTVLRSSGPLKRSRSLKIATRRGTPLGKPLFVATPTITRRQMAQFGIERERDVIVAVAQINPDLSPDRIAERVECSTERVEETLAEYDADIEPTKPAGWDDPNRCPFCGSPLEDAGAGFIEHVKSSEECAISFAQWRAGIARDIGSEWIG